MYRLPGWQDRHWRAQRHSHGRFNCKMVVLHENALDSDHPSNWCTALTSPIDGSSDETIYRQTASLPMYGQTTFYSPRGAQLFTPTVPSRRRGNAPWRVQCCLEVRERRGTRSEFRRMSRRSLHQSSFSLRMSRVAGLKLLVASNASVVDGAACAENDR